MIAALLQLVGLGLFIAGAVVAFGLGGALAAAGCTLIYLGLAMEDG